MTTFDELDGLSSAELHHRAVDLAKHRRDVRFFWELLKSIPEARTIASGTDQGEMDVQRTSAWLYDFVRGGGRLDDALRPVFIDYIQKHEDEA
jgi:hypothetical protein